MRDKEATRKKILQVGKEEFLSKGFKDAYLRDIAKKAGVTTGAIYGHYADKEALFCAIVQPVADEFIELQEKSHTGYLSLPEEELLSAQDPYAPVQQLINYIYDHFDIFKLLICHASETAYKDYFSELVKRQMAASGKFLEKMGNDRLLPTGVDSEFVSIITQSYYSDIFECVRRDMPKENALAYVRTISIYYAGGWKELALTKADAK